MQKCKEKSCLVVLMLSRFFYVIESTVEIVVYSTSFTEVDVEVVVSVVEYFKTVSYKSSIMEFVSG